MTVLIHHIKLLQIPLIFLLKSINHYKGCFTDIEEANKYAIELRNKLMTNNVFDRLNKEEKNG